MIADLAIRQAAGVLTCGGPAPRTGARQREVGLIPHATVASHAGRIVFVGPDARFASDVDLEPGARVIDARGATVLPGFVDPHTHVVFAGHRHDELRRRLAGETYAAIAASGGGILATVATTRLATEDELVRQSTPRLDRMLWNGTTTAEVKSGYGLETEAELKMLRAIRRLDQEHPMDLVATFMGAHDVPVEYGQRRQDYVDTVTREMIPAVVADGLADWCDVFCETGVFDPDDARTILGAARRAGLGLRIHADELGTSGGAAVAAEVGARSADHLIFVDAAGITRLAGAAVVATLLPAAAFYLKLGRYAPARALVDAGVPVALATDMNPGGGFSPSMPFAMTLACFAMGLTFEEALVASTINAAYAIDRHQTVGSLEVGKQMDAVIVRGDAIELVHVGTDAVAVVIKRGVIVRGAGEC